MIFFQIKKGRAIHILRKFRQPNVQVKHHVYSFFVYVNLNCNSSILNLLYNYLLLKYCCIYKFNTNYYRISQG